MPPSVRTDFTRGAGRKAAFDQQPVEACGMVSACLEARRVTGDGQWMDQARRAFNWFLGENQLQQPLYDVTTGGCRDGLHADRVNENQGAESTLSFLLALCEMQSAGGTGGVTITNGGQDHEFQKVTRFCSPGTEKPDPNGGRLALSGPHGLQSRR